MNNLLLVVHSTNMPDIAPVGTTCPVISAPFGGSVLVLMPWGSLTVWVDTLRHEGPGDQFIQFTTPEAIALAEYNRHFGS